MVFQGTLPGLVCEPKHPCPVLACVTTPSVRRSSVRNAYDPAREGGMRFAMAYRPVGGLVAHSLIHSVFSLSRSCRWSFAMVVVSTASSNAIKEGGMS